MVTIDRLSSLPLYEQIVQQLAIAIQQSRLVRGTRLPSIRQLASKLGVSPFTTVTAYDQLVAKGLVVSRAASGFFVAGAPVKVHTARPEMTGASGEINAVWLTRSALEVGTDWIAAGSCFLPGEWLQDVVSANLIQKVLRDQSKTLFHPIAAQGSFALREALSAYLRQENISADPSSILVTDGAIQAIDLICNAMLQTGDIVVTEVPGSPMLFSRLREHGVRIVSVPRKQDGLDLGALEALCLQRPPKMVFTQSVLHNPTGWSSSVSNLHRLLMLAERFGFMIAEDDTYGDLAHGTPARLAQLSDLDNVLYYSAFNKLTGPLVRLGFIAAESRKINALLHVKLHSATHCSALDEGIVLELLGSRRYRKSTCQLRQRLEKSRAAALTLFSNIGVRFDTPGDGMFLWGQLPDHADLEPLVRNAYDHKILLAHGTLFQSGTRDDGSPPESLPYLRFNVAQSNHARLVSYLAQWMGAFNAAN